MSVKIICLSEDTAGDCGLLCEHGLSLYIKTETHTLLCDTGSSDLAWKNAEKLGADVGKVDSVIISHGHYDHAGGILSFYGKNPDAKIYMNKNAVGDFYSRHSDGLKYIGIDGKIPSLPSVVFTDGNFRIDGEISVFTDVERKDPIPEGNKTLFEKVNGDIRPDTFSHEIYTVIENGGKRTLVSGCAHRGITNILRSFKTLYGAFPDVTVSGFHMVKKTEYTENDIDGIKKTAEFLLSCGGIFFTGHCTGEKAFFVMKEIMGSSLFYLSPGTEINIKS